MRPGTAGFGKGQSPIYLKLLALSSSQKSCAHRHMTLVTQSNEQLTSLLELAAGLDSGQRAIFLDRVCSHDGHLRQKLESLLSADDNLTRRIVASGPRAPALAAGRSDLDEEDTILTAPPQAWLEKMAQEFRDPVEQRIKPVSEGKSNKRPAGVQRVSSLRSDSTIGPGTCIQHYELIREVGRGGMGAVFMARDIKLGRRVAIKFLHTDDTHLVERFVLEARATARCSHENIIVIHEVSHYRAVPYMVLEYLEDEPLNRLLAYERIPPSRAVQLLLPVVRALCCAHEQSIVHRDLKPDNIFMTEAGTIKVLDFGIAKYVPNTPAVANESGTSSRLDMPLSDLELTGHGALIGTLPYMSPEQWQMKPVDHRTDIWAIGIMLYTMIVGHHPLHPRRGEQLMVTGVLDEPMPSAHAAGVDMPLGLADIIDSCLRKDKNERMPSASKLLGALEHYLPRRRSAGIGTEECPYAGLSSFQEADANRFFGREREVGTIVARLRRTPLLGLVGPSGTGKSSLVRAGVIPALQQSGHDWETLVIRPGRNPMAALANLIISMDSGESSISDRVAQHQKVEQRLCSEPGYLGAVLRGRARSLDRQILLFIDQFEELFTMSPDPQKRLEFTACLVGMADDALSPLRLILSIRSDFLDRVAEDHRFMSELSRSLLFVGQPDRRGLHDALVKPANLVGYRFEDPAIVEQMLDALQATPGCLPLLQFAAAKLWDTRDRDRRVFSRQSYDALGGVAGALATHADAVLMAMQPGDLRQVRSIFLHLVTPDHTRAIKSIAELQGLVGGGNVAGLVQHLVAARLLIVQKSKHHGPSVEIVHESMIHSWPTLARWLDENQDDVLFLEELATAANQWQSRGCPRDLLWRGEPMAEALSWRKRYKNQLSPTTEDFLQAGCAEAQRVRRVRRWTVAGVMVFLSLVAIAASIGLIVIRAAWAEVQTKERARLEAVEKMYDIRTMSRAELEAAAVQLQAAKLRAETSLEKFRSEQQRQDEQRRENDALEQGQTRTTRRLRAATAAKKAAIAERERALADVERARIAEQAARRERSRAIRAARKSEAARKKAVEAAMESEVARTLAEDAANESEKARKEAVKAANKQEITRMEQAARFARESENARRLTLRTLGKAEEREKEMDKRDREQRATIEAQKLEIRSLKTGHFAKCNLNSLSGE